MSHITTLIERALVLNESATSLRQELTALTRRLKAAHGVRLYLSVEHESDDEALVELSQIVVPDDARGAGVGSAVMREILDWADERGVILTLTPSADFGGNVRRLRQFYTRLGFVKNAGRAKHYGSRATMIRYPEGE